MANMMKSIQTNKAAQIILFFAYVLVTTAALAFSQKSVIAFLLLLLSLLLLYYMNLGTKMKWIIALLILVIVLPVSASQGPSYQAYMEVATMVGIYVCMALGLNIVVGLAGLLDL